MPKDYEEFGKREYQDFGGESFIASAPYTEDYGKTQPLVDDYAPTMPVDASDKDPDFDDEGGKTQRDVSIKSSDGQTTIDPVVGWLVCVEGKPKGKDYRLYIGFNHIGRNLRLQVPIMEDEKISREPSMWIAYDPRNRAFRVGSKGESNLVYHNGHAIYESETLLPYDRLRVGGTELLFVPFCNEHFNWEDTPASE